MTAAPKIAAICFAAALVPAAAQGAPPQLTKTQASTYARQAIKTALYTNVSARQVACVSRGAMKQVCAVRWSSGLRKTTGTVTITRSGIDTSPVDTYRIAVVERGKYSPTRRTVKNGRLVVETRTAKLGQPLRLLGYEDSEVEITPGAYIDPYTSTSEYDTPAAGSRYVAVPVTVKNVGADRSEGSLYGARLVLTSGTTIDLAYVSGCDRPTDMAPGETRVGCVAFEVPFGAVIQQLEIPGGKETGVWK
jgi:Domain of unknown function (DUF4352)